MIKIGITGHRFFDGHQQVLRDVKLVMWKLFSIFPGEKFLIYSSLAEGADRLVLSKIIEISKANYVAVLPLEINDYINDFSNEKSVDEFRLLLKNANEIIVIPNKSTREQSYLAAGEFIVDKCDVLIAVWDGQNARGLGGTGDIVQIARKRGIPLAWIFANNLLNKFQHVKRDKKQSVLYENFSTKELG